MRYGLAQLAVTLLMLSGCGAPASSQTGGPDTQARAGTKRIVMAFPRELDLRHDLPQGRPSVRPLVNPGLSVRDDQGVFQPRMAETVPTLENGLWTMFPDGRMEMTWRIREGARWHDGVPFTTEDLLFTAAVGRDKEVPTLGSILYDPIDQITALDERAIRVGWKEPSIFADQLFSFQTTLPLPRHRLEAQYLESKADFPRLTFWLYDYLGTGPFRVRSWDQSSVAVLEANPDYVLGRPKLDVIELRFIPDGNTLTATILAGAVDLAPGLGSVDRGLALREGWRDGQVVFKFEDESWIVLSPQLLNPRPAGIADPPFRRALYHAIDRQAMADTLQGGVAPVAHSFFGPSRSEYGEIEARLPHYDYDPRRATELIEALGYSRGADGAFRDRAGERLAVEILTGPLDQAFNPGAAIADYWKRIGVDTTAARSSPSLQSNPEAQATFPGFYISNQAYGGNALRVLHSSQVRLPQNGFQAGGAPNRSRYMNPEMDRLIEGYFRTIPIPDRVAVVGRIAQHVADQLPLMGIYYNPEPAAFGSRLLNVTSAPVVSAVAVSWNAHEWDVKGASSPGGSS